jgi:hypothetical protein
MKSHLARRATTILRNRGSSSLLETYEQRFRHEWLDLPGATSLLAPVVGGSRLPLRTGSAVLSCLPGSGAELDAMFKSLGLQLTRGTPQAFQDATTTGSLAGK